MHVEERACNGTASNRSLALGRAEELITYKRRKPSTGIAVRRRGNISVAAESSLLLNQVRVDRACVFAVLL